MEKAILQLETLTCSSCMHKIERAVKELDGVDTDSAKLLMKRSKLKTKFDSSLTSIDEIEKTIENLGYAVNHSKVLK